MGSAFYLKFVIKYDAGAAVKRKEMKKKENKKTRNEEGKKKKLFYVCAAASKDSKNRNRSCSRKKKKNSHQILAEITQCHLLGGYSTEALRTTAASCSVTLSVAPPYISVTEKILTGVGQELPNTHS